MLTSAKEVQTSLTINQGHSRPVSTARADSREVAIQELCASYLQAFLHNFGGKLIHAVIDGVMDDMLDCATLVMGSAVLTNMLDAPVAELTVSEYINLCYDFFNGRSLFAVSIKFSAQALLASMTGGAAGAVKSWRCRCLTFSSSTQFSNIF